MPGLAAARDPAAPALLRRARVAGPPRLPARGGGAARATSRAPSDRHRVQPPHRRHPGLPGRRHLRLRRRAGEARLERDAVAAAPAGARGGRGASCARSTAIPTRSADAAPARSPSAPACPPGAWRSATARARSCWPPPTRCSSRAPRSSTPGRRSRCTRTWPRCPAPRAITVPLDDERPARPRRDGRARSPPPPGIVIVCNPNNPTATALPPAAIDAFVADAAAPRGGDPRRGLRRVLDAPGPRRVARPARAATRTSCCCARSRRSTGSAGCAWATRSARRSSAWPSTACASRSRSTRSRRRPPPRRSTTRTRWSGAWSAPRSSACTWRRSWQERGLETTDSQANFSWVSLGDRDEDEVVDGPGRARRDRARRQRRSARRAGCGSPTARAPENDRFLAALDEVL